MMPDTNYLEVAISYIEKFGWTKGMFALFFFMSHGWIFHLYNGRLSDRQGEIDRLAADNREYRERYLARLDQHFNYSPNENPQATRN
jgi:hypothetical protein